MDISEENIIELYDNILNPAAGFQRAVPLERFYHLP